MRLTAWFERLSDETQLALVLMVGLMVGAVLGGVR